MFLTRLLLVQEKYTLRITSLENEGSLADILLCHLTAVPRDKLLESLCISISASVKWVVT